MSATKRNINNNNINFVDDEYISDFHVVFQQIDGEAFLLLNQADIVKILDIKLGPALKIYNAILIFKNCLDV
jgi:hypothetical protein